jgi:hypothetical protein
MIIRVNKRENPFAQIDRRPINDSRLSWKARGILTYLLEKPDNWEVRISDLVNRSDKDGITAVQNGMKELRKLGYASIEYTRNEKGHITGSQYVINELPINREVENLPPGSTEKQVSRLSVFPIIGFSDNRETYRHRDTNTISNTDLIDDTKETNKGFSFLIEILEAEYLGEGWFKELSPREKIEQLTHLEELAKKIAGRAGVAIPEEEPEKVGEGLRAMLAEMKKPALKWERETYRTIKQLNRNFTSIIEKIKAKRNGTAKAKDNEPSLDEIFAGIDRAVQGSTNANPASKGATPV